MHVWLFCLDNGPENSSGVGILKISCACCRFGQVEVDSDEGGMEYDWEEGDEEGVAHVPVPTQKEVEQMLIRRKKKVNILV